MSGGDPVAVDAVFERFPASVRGAVVIRGTDPDPHQVRMADAQVVEVPGRAVQPVPVEPVVVDIAPREEVLVPFDIPFADLEPGWYGLAAEVVVDGQHRIRGPAAGKRFLVPWPREEVRRGHVEPNLRIAVAGSEGAVVERLECRADRAVVRWRHSPAADPTRPEFADLRVLAGTRRLPELEASGEPATGERSTVVYPVLKRHRQLTFELDRRVPPAGPVLRGRWSATLDLS